MPITGIKNIKSQGMRVKNTFISANPEFKALNSVSKNQTNKVLVVRNNPRVRYPIALLKNKFNSLFAMAHITIRN
jgi:hypothetical protein